MIGGVFGDGGSIGLYAVAYAVGLGAEEVVFVSHDAGLCRLAAAYGATAQRVADTYEDVGAFGVTVETSGVPGALAFALRSTGPSGVCTCTAGAVHRGNDVPIPVYEMYMNTVTFTTGWVHTRSCIDEPLRLIEGQLFDPLSIARMATFDEAPEAFAEPFVKLVLADE